MRLETAWVIAAGVLALAGCKARTADAPVVSAPASPELEKVIVNAPAASPVAVLAFNSPPSFLR